jgi:transketolase C-terminal domain/subunit
MDAKERKERVMVIDCDLEGSTGLATIRKAHPEVYVLGGIMERGNISAAAGFGMQKGKQGIFSTFSAFLEMCISELTMARLNNSNLLCHFSHAGTDDMADSTCHFGINNFFADNGLTEAYDTKLYYPADVGQLRALMDTIFFQEGMRFVFTNRSSLPEVLDTNGKEMHGPDYVFKQGEDEIIREGTDGYVISFGDALYRSLDAVERLREQGLNVGLINKVCLNTVDTAVLHLVGNTPFVLVVEPFNTKTGLGIRYGTQLLENGLTPRYAHIGAHKEGSGGLWEHAYHQGYDSASIQHKIKSLANRRSRL